MRSYFGVALNTGGSVSGQNTWQDTTLGMTGYTGVLFWGHQVRSGLSLSTLRAIRDNAVAPRLNMVGFSFTPADFVRQSGGAAVPWNATQAQADLEVNDPTFVMTDSSGRRWNHQAIADGDHDDMFNAEFATLAAFDTPLFYNPFREFNAFWAAYIWQVWFKDGYWVNGNTPQSFIDSWKHLQTLASAAGATKLSWLWCPNVVLNTSSQRSPDECYPGDDYVDYIVPDGYMDVSHLTLDSVLLDTYTLLKTGNGAGYSGKQILLPDSGPSNPHGGPPWFGMKETGIYLSKSVSGSRAYIQDAATTLAAGSYPEIGLLGWFAADPNNFDSDAISMDNFRTLANLPDWVKSGDSLVASPQLLTRSADTGTRQVITPPWYSTTDPDAPITRRAYSPRTHVDRVYTDRAYTIRTYPS